MALGCSDSETATSQRCSDAVYSKIIGGEAASEAFSESSGIGRVETNDYAEQKPRCTGVLVATNVVATARHCLADAEMNFWYLGNRYRAKEYRLHPSLDLVLFSTDASCGVLASGAALANEAPAAGAGVWIAGYGKTEAGTGGSLKLAATHVSSVDDSTIIVSSAGDNGACVGDSGGPLLSASDQSALIFGVLSIGSSDCVGEDHYVRLEAHDEWLSGAISELAD